jgi:hypothetical protein
MTKLMPLDHIERSEEAAALRSQNAISKPGRVWRRYAPLVFTGHGVARFSGILQGERAVPVDTGTWAQ